MDSSVQYIHAAIVNLELSKVTFQHIPIIMQQMKNLKSEWINYQTYTNVTTKNIQGAFYVTGIIIVSAPIWQRAMDGKLKTGYDWKQAAEQAGFNLLCAVIGGILASIIAGPQMFALGFMGGSVFGSKLNNYIKKKIA